MATAPQVDWQLRAWSKSHSSLRCVDQKRDTQKAMVRDMIAVSLWLGQRLQPAKLKMKAEGYKPEGTRANRVTPGMLYRESIAVPTWSVEYQSGYSKAL